MCLCSIFYCNSPNHALAASDRNGNKIFPIHLANAITTAREHGRASLRHGLDLRNADITWLNKGGFGDFFYR